MVVCFVFGCDHYSQLKRCSFLRFPSKLERRQKWIRLCRRGDRPPTANDRLCTCHFPGGEKTYAPTIFPWTLDKSFAVGKGENRHKKEYAGNDASNAMDEIESTDDSDLFFMHSGCYCCRKCHQIFGARASLDYHIECLHGEKEAIKTESSQEDDGHNSDVMPQSKRVKKESNLNDGYNSEVTTEIKQSIKKEPSEDDEVQLFPLGLFPNKNVSPVNEPRTISHVIADKEQKLSPAQHRLESPTDKLVSGMKGDIVIKKPTVMQYKCPFCTGIFGNSVDCDLHMMKTHADRFIKKGQKEMKIFNCSICLASFSDWLYFSVHTKTCSAQKSVGQKKPPQQQEKPPQVASSLPVPVIDKSSKQSQVKSVSLLTKAGARVVQLKSGSPGTKVISLSDGETSEQNFSESLLL